MARNKTWSDQENELLTGVLEQHGEQPRRWPQEVKAMVREKLSHRSESGIYQQTLKLIKARKITTGSTAEEQGFFSARGA